ncbi:aspartate aminotransferase family protein [Caloramator sp. E03]|uniref:aspartate aminotransferase family protein n=1 Tax=Caloramator sp. E03 TaxID=2576307 RepID=UPI001110716A|nr:aspartate aminotransferase family protein [Caloramator sp. E03]QCX33779.1 aspartate aminotransferase family protein [Caloramator sp. E03]
MEVKEKINYFVTVDDALNFNRENVRENYREYISSSVVQLMGLLDFDKHFVKAEGTKVYDEDGNEYIDLLGGYGALNVGHNNKEILEEIKKVIGLPNILQASIYNFAGALAKDLALITPGNLKRTFYGNSGAEAVEGALKLAKIASGKTKLIYCRNSFHGKSMGALSVTGREKYQNPFKPLVPDCYEVPYGDADALEEMIKSLKDVAAFIVEPIQGEGGINVPPKGYLKRVREICTKYGVYLIADEIQTGFGRTGYMFACEAEDIVPDIMCFAKSIGGGIIPIGGYITTDEIWKKAYGKIEKAFLHTSTFGGNTIACAAGIASIKYIIENDLPGKAKEKGEYFLLKLMNLKEKYPVIKDVRGRGLMIGIEFEEPKGVLNSITAGKLSELSNEYFASLVAGKLMNEHRIITAYTLNNPNVIRLEPPLIISYEEIDKVIFALESIFEKNKSFLGIGLDSGKQILKSMFKK